MTEQQLDGAQIGACFQPMGRETVSKRVRVDMAMCKSGAFGCVLTSIPKNLGRDGAIARVPRLPGNSHSVGLRRSPRQ